MENYYIEKQLFQFLHVRILIRRTSGFKSVYFIARISCSKGIIFDFQNAI